ncbi:MAG: zinc ribbon domain-containing protein [Armatimonadetes bacterium]|nr:zinc ribbon domain-containing protein [Armatimonadota bacterium]
MFCSKCGRENPDSAQQCIHCSAPLAPPGETSSTPRRSGMATASLVLGLVGLITFGLAGLLGLPLGLAAIIKINRSNGRLTGRGLATAGVVLSGLWLLLLPAMVFPVFARARASARKAICLANVKNMSVALALYTADWDDRFPEADRWCESINDYVKNDQVYLCPEAEGVPCGYAYNAALSGIGYAELEDPVHEIMVFESDAGWDAAGGVELMTPEPRHLGGDNYGYADGHAAWVPRAPSPYSPTPE